MEYFLLKVHSANFKFLILGFIDLAFGVGFAVAMHLVANLLKPNPAHFLQGTHLHQAIYQRECAGFLVLLQVVEHFHHLHHLGHHRHYWIRDYQY